MAKKQVNNINIYRYVYKYNIATESTTTSQVPGTPTCHAYDNVLLSTKPKKY